MPKHLLQFALYARTGRTGSTVFVAAFETYDHGTKMLERLQPDALAAGVKLTLVRVRGSVEHRKA